MAAILDFTQIRNDQKTGEIEKKMTLLSRLVLEKKGEKRAFFFKNGLTTIYLRRHSKPIFNQTCVKMCVRNMRTAAEKGRC